MREHPILFSGPMVAAALADRKTQTRRVITRQNTRIDGGPAYRDLWARLNLQDPENFVDAGPSPAGNEGPYLHCWQHDRDARHRLYPRWWKGDRLWARETLRRSGAGVVTYADGFPVMVEGESRTWPWKVSVLAARYMPRWACRLIAIVDEVRVERVQDITEEDALAEGCPGVAFGPGPNGAEGVLPGHEFVALWNTLNAKRGYGWAANSWVWVYRFYRKTSA